MTEATAIAIISVLSTGLVGCIPAVYKLWTDLRDQHATTQTKIDDINNIISDVRGIVGNINKNVNLKLLNTCEFNNQQTTPQYPVNPLVQMSPRMSSPIAPMAPPASPCMQYM